MHEILSYKQGDALTLNFICNRVITNQQSHMQFLNASHWSWLRSTFVNGQNTCRLQPMDMLPNQQVMRPHRTDHQSKLLQVNWEIWTEIITLTDMITDNLIWIMLCLCIWNYLGLISGLDNKNCPMVQGQCERHFWTASSWNHLHIFKPCQFKYSSVRRCERELNSALARCLSFQCAQLQTVS